MEHSMTGTYNDYWFVFSILVGILFSYIALDLRWKMIIFKNLKYNLWLLGCAIAMGIGIWTMHFVGMFAMGMPGYSMYDARMVLLSLLISIAGTGLAFFMMKMNYGRLLYSSLFMGGGIVGMHYLGMEAMHLNFSITYNPTIVLLSLCIAFTSAFGSLWVLFFFNHQRSMKFNRRVLSSILMGIGIAGMHYIGMWGTNLHYHSSLTHSADYYSVSSSNLSSLISVPAIFVVLIMLLSSAFLDKNLIAQMKDLNNHEKKLRESEKLSLVGELAAGVAHEIRNPLTTLKGFAQMMNENIDPESNKRYSKIMIDEINRINFIVSEFMVLSKPHVVQYSLTDLSQSIKNVITLLNTQAIMNNIEIVPEFNGEQFLIKCEENQIKQVIANLIKNSIEAMPQGGKIQIRMEHQNANLVISVIDSGVGISRENLPLLGTPFYTTKNEGTGLGLMVSKKIIQNHNGKFEIKSVPNIATTVTITLPTELSHLEYVKQNPGDESNLSQSS
ncbi:MHYT domain-containing protein [Neobacillus sp. 179-C4.2 HS]|uniref:histidine kinase n=1 Tax=Neobacillus driksii TaxID=3035913 RepID=A0ABV4YTY4_9BACI|nr:MHYT domain-containing protein [Neobacillus sp. 179.-C4.2 HS]MDP5194890.1 MHYT domain-containing protein [Neobacillus sp. 179.-C4.2 HS]